jgi:S-adenosylmethionine:tRNA ribosyltransferase-isomerase
MVRCGTDMATPEETLAAYDYHFPEALIAQSPARPRDSARLMVHDRKTGGTVLDTFAHIDEHLPERCVLVFNETKVIPARMALDLGGKAIDVLCLGIDGDHLRAMAPRAVQSGTVATWAGFLLECVGRDGKEAIFKPSFPVADTEALLERFGKTPLPPYIEAAGMTEEERRDEYQTVFAKTHGSVAAPTAGLHFTPELIERIKASGRDVRYVTLHVGLGTFAPLTDEQIETRTLHEESFFIDEDTATFLNAAKKAKRPIVAVGTTTVRTLESSSEDGVTITNNYGKTTLFLSPENPPRFVSALVTNFHVPKSSLLMLVAGFVGRNQLMKLYQTAIAEKFRLFSFGDGMLIV